MSLVFKVEVILADNRIISATPQPKFYLTLVPQKMNTHTHIRAYEKQFVFSGNKSQMGLVPTPPWPCQMNLKNEAVESLYIY